MTKKILLLCLVLFLIPFGIVLAHPGRTASDGCHYCRTNCDYWGVPWNQRHCHGGYIAPPVSTPRPTPLSTPTPKATPAAVLFGKVTRVIDGDTIDVYVDENIGTKRIRFIGIDTPETVDPRKPVQCFGQEASQRAKELLEGKTVRLETDPVGDTIDKYGRWLRYIYVGDDLINARLVKEGYAYAYTKFPFSKSGEFENHERDAKNSGSGLWSPTACALDSNISQQKPEEFVKSKLEDYKKDHRWFRERLIDQMRKVYGIPLDTIGFWVYTILKDIK